jgi:hypothetical protein
MAFERLQARAPFIAHSRLDREPFWFFVLEMSSYPTLCWTE